MSEDGLDGLDGLAEMVNALAKEMEENPLKVESEFEYPMTIAGVEKVPIKNVSCSKTGSMVKIRPCADKYNDKTYLGIYLGEMVVENSVALFKKTNILNIINVTNPAIFVPEINKVVFGYESWWEEIESEEALKEITDGDIENIWYVKALKQMAKDKE